MAIFTLISILAFFAIFAMAQEFRPWRICLHPYTFICFQYVIYFHQRASDHRMAETVDMWVAVSFIVFSASFAVASVTLPRSLAVYYCNGVWRDDFDGTGAQYQTASTWFAFVALAWIAVFLHARSTEFGSLHQALVALYSADKLASAGFLSRIAFRSYRIVAGFGAIALFIALQGRTAWRVVLVYVFQFLGMLAIGTAGSRGNILFPATATSLIFLVARVRLGKWPRFLWLQAAFVGFSVFTAAIVGEIRGTRFWDLTDLRQEYTLGELSEFAMSGLTRMSEGGDRIADKIAFCFERYGPGSFLGLHTPYSIMVNPVPREFWRTKPVNFGTLLAWEWGYHSDSGVSLAAGIAGEGYAGCGYLGIIILAILVGALCGMLAKMGIVALRQPNTIHVLLGLLFWRASTLFVRGDMLSAWGAGLYPIVLGSGLFFTLSRLRVRQRRKYQHTPETAMKRHPLPVTQRRVPATPRFQTPGSRIVSG